MRFSIVEIAAMLVLMAYGANLTSAATTCNLSEDYCQYCEGHPACDTTVSIRDFVVQTF